MIVDGWLDWAERVDGNPQKVYTEPCRGEFVCCHSIVGWLPGHAIPGRFLSDDRVPGDPSRFTDAAAASVKFIGYDDGHLIQMYPLDKATWTSGSRGANLASDAIEEEGGVYPNYGALLSKAAEDTFIRLYTELEAHHGWDRDNPMSHLKQHKQMAQMYGSAATACASDRYSNAWARINEGERFGTDMGISAEESEAIARRVFDEATPTYFIDLMKKYFTVVPVGDFSDMPDPAVIEAINAHKHSPKGKAGRPL